MGLGSCIVSQGLEGVGGDVRRGSGRFVGCFGSIHDVVADKSVGALVGGDGDRSERRDDGAGSNDVAVSIELPMTSIVNASVSVVPTSTNKA